MKPSGTVAAVHSIAGALPGLLAFLAVALIPSLLRGGGAGVPVASRLPGAAFAPAMAVDALILFCIVSAGAVVAARAAAIPVAERS